MNFRKENETLLAGPVIYDREEKSRIFRQLIEKTNTFLPHEEQDAVMALRQLVGEVSPFMKGASYRDENEWRLFRLSHQRGAALDLNFREEDGLLKPYLEISLLDPGDGENPIPSRIYAGPGLSENIHGGSLGLLKAHARETSSNSAPPDLHWVTDEDLT